MALEDPHRAASCCESSLDPYSSAERAMVLWGVGGRATTTGVYYRCARTRLFRLAEPSHPTARPDYRDYRYTGRERADRATGPRSRLSWPRCPRRRLEPQLANGLKVLLYSHLQRRLTQGAEMRAAFMSIAKSLATYSEGMNRAATNAEPWDPGACGRR